LTHYFFFFSWWEVPEHDKALLEGICKHGVGRTDLIIEDAELPFYHVKQILTDGVEEIQTEEGEMNLFKFVWPRDLVVARRIDSLCELVLNPKPLSIRQTRKRKSAPGAGRGGRRKKTSADAVPQDGDDQAAKSEELSEEEAFDSEEDADEEDEGNVQSFAADNFSEQSKYERNQHSWREIALNEMPMEEANKHQQAPLAAQSWPVENRFIIENAPVEKVLTEEKVLYKEAILNDSHMEDVEKYAVQKNEPVEKVVEETKTLGSGAEASGPVLKSGD
jgi:hypothetical protein